MRQTQLWLMFCSVMNIAHALPINMPYAYHPDDKKIGFRAIYEIPRVLDPQSAYDSEPIYLMEQIYEPLYTIQYLSHPFKLVPALASAMPSLKFYDKKGMEVSVKNISEITKTVYTIPIRKGVYYQPHPGFCEILNLKDCSSYRRELVAQDFVYSFKRAARANVSSPIVPVLKKHIVGYGDYLKTHLDHDLAQGVCAIDKYTLQITTNGYSNQWLYWLTKVFFAPIPWEIDTYNQKIGTRSIWRQYSIGTGAFMLYNDVSYQKITLKKNPNYRKIYFDFKNSDKRFLKNQGRLLPLLDELQIVVEKEAIPKWNKFLQGYYDISNIPPESFESSIQVDKRGGFTLSKKLKNKDFQLFKMASDSTFGMAFNMNDPIVGGYTLKAQKLRQAISIAFNYDDFSSIFYNGRATVAHGPIPSGIFGSIDFPREYNHYIFQAKGHKIVKKDIEEAKRLLAQAGYPNGLDPKTHKPLVINLDIESAGLPEEKARMDWYRKQLSSLGLELNIRGTDRNRFYQKIEKGQAQFFSANWGADYPDAENFLMLFYSKNQKVAHGGPNYTNFNQPEYDKLYEQLVGLSDGPEKLKVIHAMVELLQKQAPWVWGTHANALVIEQAWVDPVEYNFYSNGMFKYFNINKKLRLKEWQNWNKFHLWPLLGFFLAFTVFLLPFIFELKKIRSMRAKRTPF